MNYETNDLYNLIQNHPNAYILLSVICIREKIGINYIHDYATYGMTTSKYRTAKKILSEKGICTFENRYKSCIYNLKINIFTDIKISQHTENGHIEHNERNESKKLNGKKIDIQNIEDHSLDISKSYENINSNSNNNIHKAEIIKLYSEVYLYYYNLDNTHYNQPNIKSNEFKIFNSYVILSKKYESLQQIKTRILDAIKKYIELLNKSKWRHKMNFEKYISDVSNLSAKKWIAEIAKETSIINTITESNQPKKYKKIV